jgi:hypothetical protein
MPVPSRSLLAQVAEVAATALTRTADRQGGTCSGRHPEGDAGPSRIDMAART